ncbi:SCO1664 family protein [Granulicoccus sp. GXG6511]|uniref:SCO1664 family protein n=1 Tax=Granulicoccus sp. GXG6511 TaxID=3381351 RepID=UPI003D7CC675
MDLLDPAIFTDGDLELTGRLVQASNATFLGELTSARGVLSCVYKPVRGERPLWDFPDGTLAEREVAAYRVSAAAGFDVVPATVLVDGPMGPGSLQAWIDVDDDADPVVDLVRSGRTPEGWFDVVDGLDAHERPVTVIHRDEPQLRLMALFDALINNADRKGAHILVDASGHIWAVDHGVSLHVQDKLRTVLWGWAGDELTPAETDLVAAALVASEELAELVTEAEVKAYEARCLRILTEGTFPLPPGAWPSIPWPPL